MANTGKTKTTTGELSRWLTLDQAADYLACSVATVRRRVADGSLPAYRLGRTQSLRVKQGDVDAMFTQLPTAAGAR